MEAVATSSQTIKENRVTTSLDFATHCFCFLSVLLIGADTWGINIGVNIRLSQLFLLLMAACLLINNSYKIQRSYSIFAFLFLTFVSSIFAYDVLRAFVFYLSILFNVFLIFYCFSNYILAYGFNKILKICRTTIYIQVVLVIIQFILKVVAGVNIPIFRDYGYYFGIPRFCLWFYEPSYFATYLLFWFAFAFYNLTVNSEKKYLRDTLLCAIGILLSTSGTGYLGAALSVALIYVIWILKNITKRKLFVFVVLVAALVTISIVFWNTIDVFIGRIFKDGLDSASGGRVAQWTETINVYEDNILFGVGPGNYGLYLKDDSSYVPSNVTLELLATTGLFATIAFYLITIELGIRLFKIKETIKNKDIKAVMAMFVSLIIFTIILQVNQGYLRLYHWMFFGLIYGGLLLIDHNYRISLTRINKN